MRPKRSIDSLRKAANLADQHRWGCATMDDGLLGTAWTRREALAIAGFATRYSRRRAGAIWEYTRASGRTFYVGRVPDLIRQDLGLRSDFGEKLVDHAPTRAGA